MVSFLLTNRRFVIPISRHFQCLLKRSLIENISLLLIEIKYFKKPDITNFQFVGIYLPKERIRN